jgi:hypothetical protein
MELRPFRFVPLPLLSLTDKRRANIETKPIPRMSKCAHFVGTFYCEWRLVAQGVCEIPPRDITITANCNTAFQFIE